MKRVYIIYLFILILSYSCKVKSDAYHHSSFIKDKKECAFSIAYENTELIKNGSIEYAFVGLKNFNVKNPNCWAFLSEFYNNIVPDSTVIMRTTYFLNIDNHKDLLINIKSKQQLNENSNFLLIIGIHTIDLNKNEFNFKRISKPVKQ